MKIVLPKKYDLVECGVIDSTSLEARRLVVRGGGGDKTVIVADSQTGGRGRMARNWVSEAGNLFFSIVLKPIEDINVVSQLSFVSALALREALLPYLDQDKNIQFKWPNDVLVDGKKISGILLETILTSNDNIADWLILGIGVNINSYPDNVVFNATSMKNEGSRVSREVILQEFLWHFEEKMSFWYENGFEPIRKAWRRFALNIGKEISVNLSDKTFSGIFIDLDETGCLEVQIDSGEVRKISSGEVFFA